MNTDVITIRADVDVDVVLRYLRMKGELPEATDALYVIDDESKLIGHLSLVTLLTTQPDVPVSEVMDDADEAIKVDMKDSDIANLFERRNWVSALWWMKTNIWLAVLPSMTWSILSVKTPNTR